MNYKEVLYEHALQAIDEIYKRSQYDPDEDLYRSFDIINSVNKNQIASKEWLIENLVPFLHDDIKKVCVMGGWYGLSALMLAQHTNVPIDSVDYDPETKRIGKLLTRGYDNIQLITEDAADWFFHKPKRYQLIINTSCEHIDQIDLDLMVAMKREDTIICFQSNNYHSIQSHINTHNSLDEFVDSLKLTEVLFKEEMKAPSGQYDRYMVIGK